jgi:hypothetical protein
MATPKAPCRLGQDNGTSVETGRNAGAFGSYEWILPASEWAADSQPARIISKDGLRDRSIRPKLHAGGFSRMSISSITPGAGVAQPWQNVFQQQRQDFSQLAQALQTGDLSGAQQAYANLQSLQQSQSSSNSNSNPNESPIQKDFAALGQALASGNLSQAQSDFSQLQNDLKSAFQNQAGPQGTTGTRRGHHHHHHAESSNQDSSNNTSVTNTNTNNGNQTGGGVNLTA